MLTLLQRVLVLISAAAALAWLAWCWHAGLGLGWAVGGVALALLPQAPVLALEFTLLATMGRDATAPHATTGQLLRAWGGEVLASWRVFGWRQPFHADREADVAGWLAPADGTPPADRATPANGKASAGGNVPADDSHRVGRTGVLLLHGYGCNRGLWAPWLRQLRAHGVPTVALSLTPAFGRIDDWVPAIEAAVAALIARTGRPPLLVAHSMGGLAARAWLASHADPQQADARVRRVVTIGTPHHGTWMARFGHTPNARQMRQGHSWLAELAAREPAARHARFTWFYSHADNIVFPASMATLPGADNRHLAGVAHVAMAFRPEVFDEVLRLLDAADSD